MEEFLERHGGVPLDIVDRFISNGVTLDLFQSLTEEHLKELCPHLDTRIKIGQLITACAQTETNSLDDSIDPSLDHSLDKNLDQSLEKSLAHSLDYSLQGSGARLQNVDILISRAFPDFDLRTLLQTTAGGNVILNYYNTFCSLDSSKRNQLTDIIIKHLYSYIVQREMSTGRPKSYQGYRAKQILQAQQKLNKEEQDEEDDPPKRTTKRDFQSRRKNDDIDEKTYSTPPKHKKTEPPGIQTLDSGKLTKTDSVNNENLEPKKPKHITRENDGKGYSEYPLTPSKCKNAEKHVPDPVAESLGGQLSIGIQVLDPYVGDVVIDSGKTMSKVKSLSLSDLTEDTQINSGFLRRLRCTSLKSLSLTDLTQDAQSQKTIRKYTSVPAELNLIVLPSILPFIPIEDEIYEDNEYFPPNNILNESSTDSNLEITDNENPNEGRKRQRKSNPKNWKRNLTKQKRMKGEDYLGYERPKGAKPTHNKPRLAKELGEQCRSDFCRKSKFRGCHRFNEETRQEIHRHYWKNLNWDQRKIYIVGLVTRVPKAVKRTSQPESKREGTLKYCLPLTATSDEKIQVCKEMFLKTLSMKSFTLQSWVSKANFGMVANQEERQKTQWKKPKFNEQVERKMAQLEEFLDRIPKLPSHYARADTSKLFIEPSFKTIAELYNAYIIAELYNAYITICNEKQTDPVCRYTFENRFKDKNLSIYTLKKDKCDLCTGYEAGNIEEADYQIHLIKKNRARKEKEEDKKKAADNQFTLLTMDVEAVKVCPYLTASALYFKTKLACHNFTVYNLTNRHCTCYWFNETASDLKSSTFASFLIDYLERHCLPLNKPIVIYSDGCTYQNRNVILANALLNFSKQHNVTITQKYLEVGHTQMECDSVHAAIEKKLKNREIHLPSNYIKVTKEARSKNPYETVEADFEFFRDYACTKTWVYKSIRPGRKAGDPQVVDIRAILYSPDSTIKVKLDLDEEWMDLPQRQNSLIRQVPYQRLHAEPLCIASTKYNHLQELKAVIPKDCHSFYDNLPKQG